MPDICMCEGTDDPTADSPRRTCRRAKDCWRHMAPPTRGRQSYFAKLPMLADGSCEYFWPIEEPSRDRRE